MRLSVPLFVQLLAISLAFVACKSKQEPKRSQQEALDTKQPTTSTTSTTQQAKGRKGQLFNIPVGPKLGIFPGQGVGPIRFGATQKTVERLMEAPCSEKTQNLCRYAAHAVDFHFEDGELVKVQIQGDERRFDDNPKHTYGIFNGRFPQGAALGMYPKYVTGMLGEPKRKQQVEQAKGKKAPSGTAAQAAAGTRADATVERHYYDGFVLEYDRLANGNVVLASVILEKP